MKRNRIVFYVISVAVFVSVFVTPHLLKDFIIRGALLEIEKREGLKVSYGESNLNLFFTGVEVTNVKLFNPTWSSSKSIMDIGSVKVEWRLLSMLNHSEIDLLSLSAPKINFETNKSGINNFSFNVGGVDDKKRKSIKLNLFKVDHGVLSFDDKKNGLIGHVDLESLLMQTDASQNGVIGGVMNVARLQKDAKVLYKDRLIEFNGHVIRKDENVIFKDANLVFDGNKIHLSKSRKGFAFEGINLHPLFLFSLLPNRQSVDLNDFESSAPMMLSGEWQYGRGFRSLDIAWDDLIIKNKRNQQSATIDGGVQVSGRKVLVDTFSMSGNFGFLNVRGFSNNLRENKVELVWDTKLDFKDLDNFFYNKRLKCFGDFISSGTISHENEEVELSTKLEKVLFERYEIDGFTHIKNNVLTSKFSVDLPELGGDFEFNVQGVQNFLMLNDQEVSGSFNFLSKDNSNGITFSQLSDFRLFPSKKIIHLTGVPLDPIAVGTRLSTRIEFGEKGKYSSVLNGNYLVSKDSTSLGIALQTKNKLNSVSLSLLRPENLTTYFLQSQICRINAELNKVSTGNGDLDQLLSNQGEIRLDLFFYPGDLVHQNFSNVSFRNINADFEVAGKHQSMSGGIHVNNNKVSFSENFKYSGNTFLFKTAFQALLKSFSKVD